MATFLQFTTFRINFLSLVAHLYNCADAWPLKGISKVAASPYMDDRVESWKQCFNSLDTVPSICRVYNVGCSADIR